MKNEELRAEIYTYLPMIDELLDTQEVPVYDRLLRAATLFVEIYEIEVVIAGTTISENNLIKHPFFFEEFVPIFRDWYFEKYGDFTENPQNRNYSGLIVIFGQPCLINIPSTVSKIETPGETAWLKFPDSLQDNESIEQMMAVSRNLEKLSEEEYKKVTSDLSNVVALTRKINLSIMSADNLNKEASNMIQGIWPHIEKCISDICTLEKSKASVGCWELHLAIEKALKVFLHQHCNQKVKGHDLLVLGEIINKNHDSIDLSILKLLPHSDDAIKLRYGEKVLDINEIIDHYNNALKFLEYLTYQYKRKYSIYNAAFLIKAAPWLRQP